ncbi:MAG: hypothetical protein U5K75_00825 [Ahrensia sp.]|nr:hypothetical protein [Ahrensia sp.]
MFIQSKKHQAEIEKAHIKSLALIAGSFFTATIILILGVTTPASAQAIQSASPVVELATMLAAPETGIALGFNVYRLSAGAVMLVGLIAMAIGSLTFFRSFVRDLDKATRARI